MIATGSRSASRRRFDIVLERRDSRGAVIGQHVLQRDLPRATAMLECSKWRDLYPAAHEVERV